MNNEKTQASILESDISFGSVSLTQKAVVRKALICDA